VRRRGLLAAALALALPAGLRAAARFDAGLLWRIESAGAEPSHVFGTLHAGDPRLGRLPGAVLAAFDGARALMLEYVADAYARERFLEAAMYLDGRTLEQAIGAEDFERAVAALAPIGVSREFIRKVKPWGVLLNLRLSRQPSGAPSPDAQLFALARERRMAVSQIEHVEEQVFTFDALAERTLRAYLARDLRGLWDAQQDYARRHPEIAAPHAELVKRVVLDRSVVMAYRMQRELRRGRAFVAVGALHLYGARGILALLEEDGYSVRRVY
jgi:uncharacterized protein YbaP (TraB family)